jgi:uncharacterized protein YecE (DUF72 family)
MIHDMLHIGTSGWSYKHWAEVFYPKEVRPEKYLEYYSERFACVELNSSFYNLPRFTTVSGWMTRTPDMFRFCVKMSRLITHHLRLVSIEDPLKKFFKVFEVMKNKLGPVLIQLPPGLSYDRPLICGFLDLLKEHYSSYRYAIEVRSKSWIRDEFFDLLSKYEIAFVIADSGDRYPYHDTVTSDIVYLRLHGREQLYASDYSETDLRSYAEAIKTWLDDGREIWVFFNNDYHGYAVRNAERLKEIIDQEVTRY